MFVVCSPGEQSSRLGDGLLGFVATGEALWGGTEAAGEVQTPPVGLGADYSLRATGAELWLKLLKNTP